MDDIVSTLDSYTYDLQVNKVIIKESKEIKNSKCSEEIITEDNILMDITTFDPLPIVLTSQETLQSTENNLVTMPHSM